MDQVHVIRHKVRVEGLSVRQVAREMGLSRNTVRRYLDQGWRLAVRRATAKPAPVRAAAEPRLEALLAGAADRWQAAADGGARYTLLAARASRRLHPGEELVAEWKRRKQEVFVPLVYRPGDLAEVDFFEVLVDIAGERSKAQMFVMRLMHSGRDFAWLYPRQDQVCFLDGHVRAFAHFGAVPHRLALRQSQGGGREASRRKRARAVGAIPRAGDALLVRGVASLVRATGHDKGGVEARGKGIRRQESGADSVGTTSRVAPSISQLVARARSSSDAQRPVRRFAEEHASMLPLPAPPFGSAAFERCRVSRGAASSRSMVPSTRCGRRGLVST